jgi:hypothetical protein
MSGTHGKLTKSIKPGPSSEAERTRKMQNFIFNAPIIQMNNDNLIYLLYRELILDVFKM